MDASRIRCGFSTTDKRTASTDVADVVCRAHEQFVDHVHFHVVPKPSASDEEGLVIQWPQKTPTNDELAAVLAELQGKL